MFLKVYKNNIANFDHKKNTCGIFRVATNKEINF